MVAGLRCELEVVVVEVLRHSCKVEVVVDSEGVGLSGMCRAPHRVVGVRADVHHHEPWRPNDPQNWGVIYPKLL